MRTTRAPNLLAAALCGLSVALKAQTPAQPTVLFQNVRVFDSKSAALSAPSHVLQDQGALASPEIRASTTRKPTSLQRFSIPQLSRFAERQKRAS